ncbi:nuclear transport factor 2 family protein [Kaistia geumhonensis]|uniref:SnoaL-like domain-containing protein n=1 Tax=Kaistia geumhonensis TaxID=410839 RepID=A0ABU0M3D5_9HYPH|nr:nuclear transport factor 2 family protein [Kaistia geumhonensis]MCX5479299.1 nuclear transport factor 2 family protein [Kaistia geumhonensis]MDQ0515479.1 hypothetical protein [Kaistia geumhonensis]
MTVNTTATPDAATLAARYIAAWNATDPAERRRLIAEAFTGDASYADPLASVSGHDGLDALIGAMQERFAGLSFRLAGKADGYGSNLRFSWELAHGGGPALAGGTDFATVSDGRIGRVTGFLDFVPDGVA